jgi:hypothetical protein
LKNYRKRMMSKQAFYGYDNEREDSDGNKIWDITDQDDKKIGELKKSTVLGVPLWNAKSGIDGSKFFTEKEKAILHIIGSDRSLS